VYIVLAIAMLLYQRAEIVRLFAAARRVIREPGSKAPAEAAADS
jgi:hypothetical protein